MKFLFLCTLLLFCFKSFSKNPSDKTLICNERGCNCQGTGCSFKDNRIIKNASTIAITCPGTTSCATKIVHALYDKYACKASVQKVHGQDYLVATECLVIDPEQECPAGTTSEIVEKLLKVCLEIPGTGKK